MQIRNETLDSAEGRAPRGTQEILRRDEWGDVQGIQAGYSAGLLTGTVSSKGTKILSRKE